MRLEAKYGLCSGQLSRQYAQACACAYRLACKKQDYQAGNCGYGPERRAELRRRVSVLFCDKRSTARSETGCGSYYGHHPATANPSRRWYYFRQSAYPVWPQGPDGRWAGAYPLQHLTVDDTNGNGVMMRHVPVENEDKIEDKRRDTTKKKRFILLYYVIRLCPTLASSKSEIAPRSPEKPCGALLLASSNIHSGAPKSVAILCPSVVSREKYHA